jgi:hypothetical protein
MGIIVGYDAFAKMRHRSTRDAADVPHRHSRIDWLRVAIYAAVVAGPWSAIALLAVALSR